jgi:hypothetical protein
MPPPTTVTSGSIHRLMTWKLRCAPAFVDRRGGAIPARRVEHTANVA